MGSPVFIGDEITAAGFRLAGAEVICPSASELDAQFDAVLARAELIVVAASVAREISAERLQRALRRQLPLISIVPDAGGVLPEDLEARVRLALGLAT